MNTALEVALVLDFLGAMGLEVFSWPVLALVLTGMVMGPLERILNHCG